MQRRAGVHYKATCANVRAVERALNDLDLGFGVNEISLLVSASESHSMKNLRQSRADQGAGHTHAGHHVCETGREGGRLVRVRSWPGRRHLGIHRKPEGLDSGVQRKEPG